MIVLVKKLVKMVVKMRGEVVTMKGEAKPGIPAREDGGREDGGECREDIES